MNYHGVMHVNYAVYIAKGVTRACLRDLKNMNHQFLSHHFFPQDSDEAIQDRLHQLERTPLNDGFLLKGPNLHTLIENCKEQYNAIKITAEWIRVCFDLRFCYELRCLPPYFFLFHTLQDAEN